MPQNLNSKSYLAVVAISTLSMFHVGSGVAQEIQVFATHDEANTATVETQPYSEIIAALTIEERGRSLIAFDIARAEARPFFQQYVDYLAAIPVETLNRNEQLAYWLHTRNVLLIQALAEERRVSRFKRKRGTPDDPGAFWTDNRITVSGISLSLQDIEENILFAGWDDPNLIFGLYQAMEGGPTLPREPYSGDRVTEQLAEAGRTFVSSPRNLRVRGNNVRITTYFDWYSNFAYGGDETEMRQHLSSLVREDQKAVVRTDGKVSRRDLSTSFEQFRTRQVGAGVGSGGSRPPVGAGS